MMPFNAVCFAIQRLRHAN